MRALPAHKRGIPYLLMQHVKGPANGGFMQKGSVSFALQIALGTYRRRLTIVFEHLLYSHDGLVCSNKLSVQLGYFDVTESSVILYCTVLYCTVLYCTEAKFLDVILAIHSHLK